MAKRKHKNTLSVLQTRQLDKEWAFCLFTMLILGSLSFHILLDYINLPHLTLIEKLNLRYIQASRFWEFNIGNGFVSRFEDMIFYVATMFFMLRSIDLARILIKYPKSNF